jgi:hypothetical protein
LHIYISCSDFFSQIIQRSNQLESVNAGLATHFPCKKFEFYACGAFGVGFFPTPATQNIDAELPTHLFSFLPPSRFFYAFYALLAFNSDLGMLFRLSQCNVQMATRAVLAIQKAATKAVLLVAQCRFRN